MSYGWIEENFDKIKTNFDDNKLADYIQNVFLKVTKKSKIKIRYESLPFYIKQLKTKSMVGEHSWNNLATIFILTGQTLGMNFELPYAYCLQRRRNLNIK